MEENRDCGKKDFEEKRKAIPGKLDHATVVAYEVGHFQPHPLKLTSQDKRRTKQQLRSNSGKRHLDYEQGKSTKASLHPNAELMSLLGIFK